MTPKEHLKQLMKDYSVALERQDDLAVLYVDAMRANDEARVREYKSLMKVNRDHMDALMTQMQSIIEDPDFKP